MKIFIFFILTLFLMLDISHAQNVQPANPQSSTQQPPAQQPLPPAQQQLNDQILDQKLLPSLPITPDESRILSNILSPQMDRFGAIQDKIRQWQILGVVGDMYFVSGSTAQSPGSVGVVSGSWYPIPAKKNVMRKYGCNFNYPFIECKEALK